MQCHQHQCHLSLQLHRLEVCLCLGQHLLLASDRHWQELQDPPLASEGMRRQWQPDHPEEWRPRLGSSGSITCWLAGTKFGSAALPPSGDCQQSIQPFQLAQLLCLLDPQLSHQLAPMPPYLQRQLEQLPQTLWLPVSGLAPQAWNHPQQTLHVFQMAELRPVMEVRMLRVLRTAELQHPMPELPRRLEAVSQARHLDGPMLRQDLRHLLA